MQIDRRKAANFRVPTDGPRAFYPASQEWGALGAKPPIKVPKEPMGRATRKKGKAAIAEFERLFPTYYDLAIRAERTLAAIGKLI